MIFIITLNSFFIEVFMKTRFITSWVLGLTVFSYTIMATASERQAYEQASIDQVQEHTTNAVNGIVDSILSIPYEECNYENTLKLWNEFFQQLSEVFYTLNTTADSNLSSDEGTSQSMEDLNVFITEVMNYPPPFIKDFWNLHKKYWLNMKTIHFNIISYQV